MADEHDQPDLTQAQRDALCLSGGSHDQAAGASHAMLLFLDFDGVLHPAFCKARDYFCHMPLFAAAMREHPEVSIVISSTWRCIYPLDELRKAFPADIAARVIGMTPEADGQMRHVEITQYLEQHAPPGAPWVALDDNHFSFPDHCANLVACDGNVGLSAEAIEKLRGLIRQLKTPDRP